MLKLKILKQNVCMLGEDKHVCKQKKLKVAAKKE